MVLIVKETAYGPLVHKRKVWDSVFVFTISTLKNFDKRRILFFEGFWSPRSIYDHSQLSGNRNCWKMHLIPFLGIWLNKCVSVSKI